MKAGSIDNISDNLLADDRLALSEVAVFVDDDEKRSGTCIVKDSTALCAYSCVDGLELLPIAAALKKYAWLKDRYYWGIISREKSFLYDKFSCCEEPLGYFLKVRKGMKIQLPVQTALYMTEPDEKQLIHNIIIMEDDSELELITGCVSKYGVRRGEHNSISETYIGKNVRFQNTMIHNWGADMKVISHSAALVEEDSRYINNYVALRPAGTTVSDPVTYLDGRGASAKYFSIILGSEDSMITIGGNVYLNAKETSAEIAHRAVGAGGRILQKGLLVGNAPCHAHVDCAGMLITSGSKGFVKSVPGLKSCHPEACMSHEASIGRIAPQQVQYLMTYGMEEREAVSCIIRGFLDVDIHGFGHELDRKIAQIAELAGHGV